MAWRAPAVGKLREGRQGEAQCPDSVQGSLQQLQPGVHNHCAAVHAAARLAVPSQARLHSLRPPIAHSVAPTPEASAPCAAPATLSGGRYKDALRRDNSGGLVGGPSRLVPPVPPPQPVIEPHPVAVVGSEAWAQVLHSITCHDSCQPGRRRGITRPLVLCDAATWSIQGAGAGQAPGWEPGNIRYRFRGLRVQGPMRDGEGHNWVSSRTFKICVPQTSLSVHVTWLRSWVLFGPTMAT